MLQQEALLVMLVKLVDKIPEAPAPEKRRRGRPKVYADRLIVKAVVIMVIRRLYTAYSFLAFLEQDTSLTHQLKAVLTDEQGRFPSRRTWERRLKQLPDTLPGLIGSLGCYLVFVLCPFQHQGRAVAVDSTRLCAHGGVWHKKHREAGIVPHSSIDTEANWSKSGYHGWWYGWKLHLACTIGSLWIPLAAEVTVANTYDAVVAPKLLEQLPDEIHYILGDRHYRDEDGLVEQHCHTAGRILITTQPGKYPHQDDGVEVRRIFHKLRSLAIEPFNGLFKNVFDWHGQVPVKGLKRVQLIVLGAVLVYQLALLYQFEHHHTPGIGIKPLLRAA